MDNNINNIFIKAQASLDDLLFEVFLRRREREMIVWKTKDGKEIPINKLDDEHLENIINLIYKRLQEECAFDEALSGFPTKFT